MKIKLIYIAVLLGFNWSLISQTISSSVVASGGNTITNGTTTMDVTIGELVITDINNSETTLNQGFQQTTVYDVNTVSWDGSTNSFWTEITNWSTNSVPETPNDVVIPNTPNSPIISSGVTAEMNDLTVGTSASFDISDNGAVLVNGNLETNETINIGSSTNTSGTLIVKGRANGMISYERTGLLANKWSIITAPVSGQSIKEFIENPANGIRVNPTVTPNRYAVAYYDDAKATGSKWTYYTADDIQTNTLTFEKGKGYIISRATDGSVYFTGTIETTDVSVAVQAGQWNSLGNPYTAYMPVNNNAGVNFIQENINKFNPANVGVYIWDVNQNKYIPQTLVGNPISLAVGQGFFIRTTEGVSTVNFKEAQRLSDASNAGVFSRKKVTAGIQITASQDGISVNTHIKYLPKATNGLDSGYDLGNFEGAEFDIYTQLVSGDSEEQFTIQSLPNTKEAMVIPLGITSKAKKEVTITVSTENLGDGMEVFLEDNVLQTKTKLTNNTKHSIVFNEDVKGTGRFYLHVKGTTLTTDNTIIANNTEMKVYTVSNKNLMVEGIHDETFTLSIYNSLGGKVVDKSLVGKGKNSILLNELSTGVYVVKVTSKQRSHSKKVIIK
ncbi:conserved protein of unknown function precursor containing a type A C-terminal secretion signal [Tenacibaculum sp. 190524A02b]|uniref:T9SS type A sorting domain-containing protein n=1 Tax=Tenacibaculum vairaonense TaxID=3137860 RepID=UPI0032B2C7E6